MDITHLSHATKNSLETINGTRLAHTLIQQHTQIYIFMHGHGPILPARAREREGGRGKQEIGWQEKEGKGERGREWWRMRERRARKKQ